MSTADRILELVFLMMDTAEFLCQSTFVLVWLYGLWLIIVDAWRCL